MSEFYAYLHSKPNVENVNPIFYVGKGCGKRAYDFSSNRNKYHKNITAKYKKQIEVKVIPCSNEVFALQLEIGLIKTLRRMGVVLCNMTDGGDGISGYSQTQETKDSISLKLRGREAPNKGKPSKLKGSKLTESHKMKLSAAKLGKPSPRAGVLLSDDTRNKIISSNLNRVWVNNGVKNAKPKNFDLDAYLCSGFVIGRLPSKRTHFN